MMTDKFDLREDNIMPATTVFSTPRFSAVLETPAAEPADAYRHFAAKFAFETDVADLMGDLNKGNHDIVVVDTRSPKSGEDHAGNHISTRQRQGIRGLLLGSSLQWSQ
jgi:hypothetical protein